MIPKVKMSGADFEALQAKMSQHVQIQAKDFLVSPLQFQVDKARTAVRRGPWQSTHKYNAKRVEIDGVKFHSTSEGARYHYLKAEQLAGRLIFFLMQTRIDIPGSTYRLDFLEFWADGRIVWLDVKGFETEAFKIKRRAVEAIYPFKITTARQRGRGDAKTWEYA